MKRASRMILAAVAAVMLCVLCGAAPFTGKLPSPWYASADQIGTDQAWLPMGYGLTAE